MGDHTETLQVEYDPNVVSYNELLEIYWKSHDPFRQIMSRQYMNIIFVHNEEQERMAQESKALLAQKKEKTIYTNIVSSFKFYPAEDYHQKYYLQNVPALMDEFMEIYPYFQDLVYSTAAARVNGYIGGYGDANSLSWEIESLGLSDYGAKLLQKMVK